MQSLLPAASAALTDDDLIRLYAYPAAGTWVRSNFVGTVDGAVQGGDGRSGSISPQADQRLFALLRSLCDVVLVGAGTARAEGYQPVRTGEVDAALRHRLGLTALPAVAVVSGSLELAGALRSPEGGPALVLTTAAALRARSDTVPTHWQMIVAGEEEVDPAAAIEQLGVRGLRRIQCEGGPALLRDLLASDCCDDICSTIAPAAVGGAGYRMTRGAPLRPPVDLRLEHVLHQDGTLFCRYTRMRG
ncbi:MAG TPA: dihydrofolate reductase family protein [Nocardioidaceae bacterium]|nr:dihydrofolate reductase family protein [Nocardioidaceae bacterium]